jgi:secreted PhoX family phosphatase
MRRRALLAAGVALAGPARAQITTLDLAPAVVPVRPDDWIARGHKREMLVRWGDRVTFDAPPWEPRAPNAEAAGGQFGWDARLAGLVRPSLAADGVPRLVMAVVHPELDAAMALPGGRDRPAIAAAMAGASLLNLERQGSAWVLVDGGFQSRRLGHTTLCRLHGPALSGAVQGILPPAGGTPTPWGSLLLAEPEPGPWLARLRELGPRFEDARHFGWVVEVDPLDPQSVPTKRTALGRIGAVALAAAEAADGRAVVFVADGRPAGFLYRFVSAGPARVADALDAGTLSVARIEGEAIAWLPLPAGSALAPEAAAERAGASAFDRPSALALDPRRPRLLLACRGGGLRQPGATDALNPRAGAHPGHVVEFSGDLAAPRMAARLLFLAGDAAEGGRYGRDMPPPVAPGTLVPRYPASLDVDGRGRLWIGTDRGGRPGAAPDAVFACDLDGPGRGLVYPVYGAPRGAAIGGAATTPEDDALIVVVRTPGAEPGASFDRPATRWPAFDPRLPPRSAVLALSRIAGPPVGG